MVKESGHHGHDTKFPKKHSMTKSSCDHSYKATPLFESLNSKPDKISHNKAAKPSKENDFETTHTHGGDDFRIVLGAIRSKNKKNTKAHAPFGGSYIICTGSPDIDI